MAEDLIMLSYDAISDIPVLRWLFKILRWYLKKRGKLKDYEDLYKTDNSLKVFSNALKKIGVDLNKFIKEEGIEIPMIFLFKRQTNHSEFTSEKLKECGFKYFNKSMGLWILPPKKVLEYKIKTFKNVKDFLNGKIDNDDRPLQIRFGLRVNYLETFLFPKEKNEFLDFISADLIDYINKTKLIKYSQKLRNKKILQTQADLINSTPLQHMFADFLSKEYLDLLSEKEDIILDELEQDGLVGAPYFLHLKDIDKSTLINKLREHGIVITEEVIGQAKKHAEFIVNRIHL